MSSKRGISAPLRKANGSSNSARFASTMPTDAPMRPRNEKARSAFRENGLIGPVSLAAFVERPQAERQIGAVRSARTLTGAASGVKEAAARRAQPLEPARHAA